MLSLGRTWIGVVVAVAGNVTISLALNCQKLAHTRLRSSHGQQLQKANFQSEDRAPATQDEQDNPYPSVGSPQNSTPVKHNGHANADSDGELRSLPPEGQNGNGMDTMFLHSRLWWLGLALMTIGEAGNFISYGFAPASLVAPLGAVALLSNVIISPILLGEKFKLSDIGGILLAIIGAVTVVFSSKQNDVRLDPYQLLLAIKRLEFVIYTAVSISAGGVLAFLSRTRLGDQYVLIDVGTCAIFGGFTVLSTKGISSLISSGQPIEALKFPITYALVLVLAVTAVVQITYLNKALQRFDSREVIPTQFVFFTISAIVGSAILYRDFENMDAHRLINFLFGCLTTFAGVFVLTWRNGAGRHRDDDEVEAGVEPEDEEIAAGDEEQPLLSHSWHGNESGPGASSSSPSSPKPKHRTPRQRIEFLQPAFEPTSALRVPRSSQRASPARRARSRTNSPHTTTSTRLSNSFDRAPSQALSRSASNQPITAMLSTSSSAAGPRTPKLGLMSMDRPTGLSAGHYLLLATPPPSFTLNPVAQHSRSSASNRSSQYGAIGGNKRGSEGLLPFPVTTSSEPESRATRNRQASPVKDEPAPHRRRSSIEQDKPSPTSAPTAAETILIPVAETSANASASANANDVSTRLMEHVTSTRSPSDPVSESETSARK